jgi:hypothetical protein
MAEVRSPTPARDQFSIRHVTTIVTLCIQIIPSFRWRRTVR